MLPGTVARDGLVGSQRSPARLGQPSTSLQGEAVNQVLPHVLYDVVEARNDRDAVVHLFNHTLNTTIAIQDAVRQLDACVL